MKSRKLCALSALAGLVALGCNNDKDALEKRVVSLQEELIAVQNSNDRLAERLAALEVRQAQFPAPARVRAAAAAPEDETPAEAEGVIERPPLKIVRLAPSSQAPGPSADPAEESDDSAPRPVIRDLGSGKKFRERAASGGVGQTGGH
jgi:hypothetical protein